MRETVDRRKVAPPASGYNLVGQRLGRKGLETRERILVALLRILDGPVGEAVTLTGVAREASVGMTTLYLYFPDLGDLLVAALSRVMEGADEAFIDRLRVRWPDERLRECCQQFAEAHLTFWKRYAGVLHLRNTFADTTDLRLLEYRWRVSGPLIDLLVEQMGGLSEGTDRLRIDLASVALAGLERTAALVTHRNFHVMNDGDEVCVESAGRRLVAAQATMLELTISDQRGLERHAR